MLNESTWSLTGLGKYGMLCVKCVERRIGRMLKPNDFNNSYLNKPRTGIISSLLISRMQSRS